MSRQTVSKEVTAILVSVLFLVLGFFAIWVTRTVMDIEGDAVFVSLLLVPILVYVIFSGRLKEIRAPGGLEAKFSDAADRSVEPAFEPVEASIGEMQVVTKGGMSDLRSYLPHVDESKPIILTVTLGRQGYYGRTALQQYMDALSQFRNFKFVVMLDSDGRFVAYMPSWMAKQILSMESLGEEFVEAINEGRVLDLRRYGAVTTPISTKTTNIQAIQEMTAQNLEALVVIDEQGRPKGVVEREQVLSKLLLAMAT